MAKSTTKATRARRTPKVTRTDSRTAATVPAKLKAVLRDAVKEPAREPYIQAREVMPAVHLLRQKGLGWREVMEWFDARKMHWSQNALANEYKRWLAATMVEKKRKK